MMHRVLIIFLLLLGFGNLYGQDRLTYIKASRHAFQKKEYADCAKFLQKAIEIKEGHPQEYVNLAVCFFLDKDTTHAIEFLNLAIDSGYLDIYYLRRLPHFRSFHQDAQWKGVMARLQKKLHLHEQNLDKDLRKKLFTLKYDNEAFVDWMDSVFQRYSGRYIDSVYGDKILAHRQRINDSFVAILEEYGWPKRSDVGEDGAEAAFYLIQRLNPENQAKYLPMLGETARNGEANLSDAATLHDLVLRNQGKPQKYGTQIYLNHTGELVFYPIEDTLKVDQLRKNVGLSPLKDYARRFGIDVPKTDGE